MSQVFPHHIPIKKLIYKVFCFIIKIWWGKTWNMHKRTFQGLNALLCMLDVSVLPHHILIRKLVYEVFSFCIKIWLGRPETCINVRFMAWNARLRMFEVLPHNISKNGGGRPETGINVRFSPWNARWFMSQVFPHHIPIKKLIYKVFCFIIKIWWGKTWNMHKRTFQGLKRTFMHVGCLRFFPTIFW